MAKTTGFFLVRRAVALSFISFLTLFLSQRILGANTNIAQSIKRGELQTAQSVPTPVQQGFWIQLHKNVKGEPAVFVPEEFQRLAAYLLGLHKKDLKNYLVSSEVKKFYDAPEKVSKEKQEALWLLSGLNSKVLPKSVDDAQKYLNETDLAVYEELYAAVCKIPWLDKETGTFSHIEFVLRLQELLVDRYVRQYFRNDGSFDITTVWEQRLSAKKFRWNELLVSCKEGEKWWKKSVRLYLVEFIVERTHKAISKSDLAKLSYEETEKVEAQEPPRKLLSPKTPSTTQRRIERWEKMREEDKKRSLSQNVARSTFLKKPLVRATLFVAWTAACLAVGLGGKDLYRRYKAGTLFTKAVVAQPSWFARFLAWFSRA